MIRVRAEMTQDIGDIHMVNRLAFGQEDEAALVQRIRKSSNFMPELSLVAEKGAQIIGHILFSRIYVVTSSGYVDVLSLAPMAVLPEFQNSGVGSQLVRAGLEKCRELGHKIVVVIGHPEYYPRFGFVPARQKNLDISFPVPDEAFMVCELEFDALKGIGGKVKFPPEFEDVT